VGRSLCGGDGHGVYCVMFDIWWGSSEGGAVGEGCTFVETPGDPGL